MDWRHHVRAPLLGLVYFAAAGLAVAFTRYGGTVANLWLASGILIAVLASIPTERWPLKIACCFVGSAVATGLWGMGWWAAAPMAAVKMAEAAIGAWLFRRIDKRRQPAFDSFTWFFRFVGVVGIVAPAVAALGLAGIGWLGGKPFAPMASGVFIANSLGNLATVPLVLPIASPLERRETWANVRRSGWRFAFAIGIVIACSLAVFQVRTLPLMFIPVMPLLLATFIIGREAAALGVVALATIAGILTIAGQGPLMAMDASPGERLLMLQFYISTTVLTLVPVAADLHAKRRIMAALSESEARFRLIAEQSSDIIARIDADGRLSYISPAIERLCGYRAETLLGSRAIELVIPQWRADVIDASRAILEEKDRPHVIEWLGQLADGRQRWFETNGSAILAPDGSATGSLHIIRDIHDRKLMEEELARAALTDPLTGLPNRRAFRDSVDRRRGAPGAGAGDCLAMFDIDHFKAVNDAHGHDGGDAVLRQFAAVARLAIREGDTLARLGGEEFALLMPDTPVPVALLLCDRVRRAVAFTPTQLGRKAVEVTVSVGVAPVEGRGIDEVLRAADLALYEAKSGGRDQVMLAA